MAHTRAHGKDMAENCLNCHFAGTDVVGGYEALVCRRYAPRIFHGSGTGWSKQAWPVVSTEDWCGEWELDTEGRFSKDVS